MKKIKQFTFVLFIFSALSFSYPVTQVFGQGAGQCDNSLACNPTSGTCCNNQCDPGPACNPNDPNALPCCSSAGDNDTSSVAPPQRGSAPPEHDQMTHDRRTDRLPPHKMGEELREKLNECQSELEEFKSAARPQQNCAPVLNTPTPISSTPLIQTANEALDTICADVDEAYYSVIARSCPENATVACLNDPIALPPIEGIGLRAMSEIIHNCTQRGRQSPQADLIQQQFCHERLRPPGYIRCP